MFNFKCHIEHIDFNEIILAADVSIKRVLALY